MGIKIDYNLQIEQNQSIGKEEMGNNEVDLTKQSGTYEFGSRIQVRWSLFFMDDRIELTFQKSTGETLQTATLNREAPRVTFEDGEGHQKVTMSILASFDNKQLLLSGKYYVIRGYHGEPIYHPRNYTDVIITSW